MEDLHLICTSFGGEDANPLITTDFKKSIINFEGEFQTYDFEWKECYLPPLKAWLDEYNKSELIINFNFLYVTEDNSENLIKLLKKIITNAAYKIQINWHCHEHDPDMKELGEEIAEAVGLDFNYVIYS